MKIIVFDRTAAGREGSGLGAAAQFSTPTIAHLRAKGHQVIVAGAFNPQLAAEADVVWTEWCNEDAFEAAASGVCNRLVVRMRGYDVWYPLEQLDWSRVHALVYESEWIRQLAEERFPKLCALELARLETHVIPAGVDLRRFPFKNREKPSNAVALVARAIPEKGYQLAYDWMRTNHTLLPAGEELQLHVTAPDGGADPRFLRYIGRCAPPNVYVHGEVDTARFLQDIDASFILCASTWETLGYSILEGMAMGCKPLIYAFPGAEVNWPKEWLWHDTIELEHLVHTKHSGWDPVEYRNFVEAKYDAAKRSIEFERVLLDGLEPRAVTSTPATINNEFGALFDAVNAAVEGKADVDAVANAVMQYRDQLGPAHGPGHDERFGLTFGVATAYFHAGALKLDRAEIWATRALTEGPRPELFCLLAIISEMQGDIENAARWLRAASAIDNVPSRYSQPKLVDGRHRRCMEVEQSLRIELPKAQVPKYTVVVPVRNAAGTIEKTLTSLRDAGHLPRPHVIIVDDASTDGTADLAAEFSVKHSLYWRVIRGTERLFSLHNIVRAIDDASTSGALGPEDVVVVIDGDDWLDEKANLFAHLDKAYEAGAWLTYGSFRETTGRHCYLDAYPQRILHRGLVRQWPWRAAAPRTFKWFLFNAIDRNDLLIDGEWPKTAGDVALYMPMFEMARERAFYIPQETYVYNVETGAQDHVLDPYEQVRVRDYFMAKKPYTKLVR